MDSEKKPGLEELNLACITDRKTGHRIAVAIHQDDCMQWGCPYCGYRSASTHISAHGSAALSCGECGRGFVMTSHEENVEFESNVVYVLITHPRTGIPSHGQPDTRPENGGEHFGSRGLGKDWTPGCFVCGGERTLYNNISGFVECKASGERVVAMFKTGAKLDYREHEPDYIQVKVGACDKHRSNLERLHALTSEAEGVIRPEMIAECS